MHRFTHRPGGRSQPGDNSKITLAQLKDGQSGTVVEIQGGHRMADRLNAQGIVPGKKITKTTAMLMRGPVTVEVDRVAVAIGFGMARRIMVRPDHTP
jgi:ferrous iron transport protein A